MDARGSAAIITGGASGLGGATATRLAKAGAKVTIFDLNEDLGRKLAAEIGGHFVKVNVTDEAAVDAALAEAEGLHGKARICVNCAGIGPPAKVIARDGSPLPLADFNKIIQVNLLGTFNVLSKFAARLHTADPVGEERGVIVNTASVAAFDGQIGQPAYAASKGGIVGMTLPHRPRPRPLRHPRRHHRAGPLPHAPDGGSACPKEAQDSLGEVVPFPPAARPAGRIRHALVEAISSPTPC
jgi:NAD(P)-dependent dehydrogenase (short-subunit alcohol dehydrogenase family)